MNPAECGARMTTLIREVSTAKMHIVRTVHCTIVHSPQVQRTTAHVSQLNRSIKSNARFELTYDETMAKCPAI